MRDPIAEQLFQMIGGYWTSQIVGTVARLGIADQLAAKPQSADQLASAIGTHPDATRRVLQAAGLQLDRILETQSPMQIIEASARS